VILPCFSPPDSDFGNGFLASAREVARDVLEGTYLIAPDKAKDDIKSAIEEIEAVKPSPIFRLPQVLKAQ
jgi:hypothetical protein